MSTLSDRILGHDPEHAVQETTFLEGPLLGEARKDTGLKGQDKRERWSVHPDRRSTNSVYTERISRPGFEEDLLVRVLVRVASDAFEGLCPFGAPERHPLTRLTHAELECLRSYVADDQSKESRLLELQFRNQNGELL